MFMNIYHTHICIIARIIFSVYTVYTVYTLLHTWPVYGSVYCGAAKGHTMQHSQRIEQTEGNHQICFKRGLVVDMSESKGVKEQSVSWRAPGDKPLTPLCSVHVNKSSYKLCVVICTQAKNGQKIQSWLKSFLIYTYFTWLGWCS